jgi:hypothetical protein
VFKPTYNKHFWSIGRSCPCSYPFGLLHRQEKGLEFDMEYKKKTTIRLFFLIYFWLNEFYCFPR